MGGRTSAGQPPHQHCIAALLCVGATVYCLCMLQQGKERGVQQIQGLIGARGDCVGQKSGWCWKSGGTERLRVRGY